MRKMSAYARKQRRSGGGTFNGAAWANTIQRCRAYTNEDVVPGWNVGNTQVAADEAAILVRTAYLNIRDGLADSSDYTEHDRIAHAIGVSLLRAYEIAGEDPGTNPMLPILITATDAMRRVGTRYERIGKWGFDGPAIDEVGAAIDLYETILQSSSPAQMVSASEKRIRILKEQGQLK